jgi:dihydroorotate dehydrogenase (NAD+) catalytic subunit
MPVKLGVNIGKLKLKNPVMVASGTFGYAEEFRDLVDLKQLGAIVSKTITIRPRRGNAPARTCETPAGMLNSIGLENPGVEAFLQEKLPALAKIGVPLIVSIASEHDPEEFVTLAKRMDKIREASAIEANISCPNLKRTRLISQDPKSTYDVISKIRKVTRKTLIAKLSPNVTDIGEIARAAQAAGSDAVSLINTLTGMSIDVDTREPKLTCVTGGLSGPAIRPVAVRMAWEVSQKISIPIIGMGGIMDISSALEFLIAGATAVAVGTGNFVNPGCAIEVVKGLKKYLEKNKIKDMQGLIGSLKIEE